MTLHPERESRAPPRARTVRPNVYVNDPPHLPRAWIGDSIINRQIGIHPRALLEFDVLPADLHTQASKRIAAYPSPREFFVQCVAEGVGKLAAVFAQELVIVRMSDFKPNEYANRAWRRPVRAARGDVKIMIPFVRTVAEGAPAVDLLAENDLRRGENGLEVVTRCEVPSSALLADEFLDHFDGFSIGSNDLTQLTLGLDRDPALVAHTFDERDPAVKKMLAMAIEACKRRGKYVGRRLAAGVVTPVG